MIRIIKIIANILFFCLLTVFTQVGGVIYLASFALHKFIDKKTANRYYRFCLKSLFFVTLYVFCVMAIIPPIAGLFGRVPLPITKIKNLQPLNVLTCLLNRNYVRPALRQTAFEASEKMNKSYPGTVVNYLDASFPFINKFPLLPHLSHNDGKKLDLAFCYIDNKTSGSTNAAPSVIGYGVSEEPRLGEKNTAQFCAEQGYWQYSLLMKIISQKNKANFTFDSVRTKKLVEIFADEKSIGKIFIEPHLKDRLKLTTPKIRFHGCRAVRHDDHIHVQLI